MPYGGSDPGKPAHRASFVRTGALTVALTLVLASPATQAAVSQVAQGGGRSVAVVVNDRPLPWPARLWQGILLAPVRAVAEALGASVTWNAATREAVVRKGSHTVRLRVGSRWAWVDGRRVELAWPTFLDGGRLHAPARFLASALGAGLSLDVALTRALIREILPAAAPAAAPVTAGAAQPAAQPPQPTAQTAAHPATSSAPAQPAQQPVSAGSPAPTTSQPPAPPTPPSPAPAGRDTARPTAPTPPLPPRLVLGYHPVDYDGDTLADQSLARHGRSVDLVALFGYRLLPDGSLDGGPAARHLPTVLAQTRRWGQRLLAVVHNAAWGGFDRNAVSAFLADDRARRNAVQAVVRLMEDGFAGVNLDLENVAPWDRDRLTDFAGQLAAALRAKGYLFTMAVPAKTWDDPTNGWSAAYDYAALGRTADLLVIMAYDEHWAGGPAGPVASFPWVRDVVRYAVSTIPPDRILLGIPAYGYDWPPWGGATALSAPGAERLARNTGAALEWDPSAQVPFFRYWDSAGLEHTVFYENASSAAGKVDLALGNALRGVAVWRLGLEDPALWGVLDSKLR